MGCVASKAEFGDSAPNIFRVWNVDEGGRVLAPGHLELTEVELILHQRGREAVHWPMRCLRRYGFEAELFSFESGRRCHTGPGVYAFKCHRADELFNQLQEHIQACGQEEQSHGSGSVPRSSSVSEGYLEPTGAPKPRGYIRPPFSLPNSLSSSSTGLLSPTGRAGSPHYANEDLLCARTTTPQHNNTANASSENELMVMCNGSDDNYAKLDDLLKQERLYINVKPDTRVATRCAHSQPPPTGSRRMNYIILDLDKNGGAAASEAGGTTPTSPLSLTSLPESPERGAEGYVTIDFERTAALSCASANGAKDESQRKTRHNSNISDLILSRHNSAVSE